MTTYIAGPMSGIPDHNYPLFNRVAAELRAQGEQVRNPAEHDHGLDQTWEFYARHALRQLLDCDTILLLPGWAQSRGACLEYRVAHALGMTIQGYEPHGATQAHRPPNEKEVAH